MNTRTIKKNISRGFGHIIDLFKIDELGLNSIKKYETDLILELESGGSGYDKIFNTIILFPSSICIQDNIANSIDIKISNYFNRKPNSFHIVLSYIEIIKDNAFIGDKKKYEFSYKGLELKLTKREFEFNDYINHFVFNKRYTTKKLSIRRIDLDFCLDSIIMENDVEYLNFITKQWKKHMERNVDSIIQNLEKIDKRKERYENQKNQYQYR